MKLHVFVLKMYYFDQRIHSDMKIYYFNMKIYEFDIEIYDFENKNFVVKLRFDIRIYDFDMKCIILVMKLCDFAMKYIIQIRNEFQIKCNRLK